jgi:hypothetical protein
MEKKRVLYINIRVDGGNSHCLMKPWGLNRSYKGAIRCGVLQLSPRDIRVGFRVGAS